jgi:hypothetical protein
MAVLSGDAKAYSKKPRALAYVTAIIFFLKCDMSRERKFRNSARLTKSVYGYTDVGSRGR